MKLTVDIDNAEDQTSDDMADDDAESIYVGGAAGAWEMFNTRRWPAKGKGNLGFPTADCDLDTLRDSIVKPGDPYYFSICAGGPEKESALLNRLSYRTRGKTELELLHVFCIANLRRIRFPSEAKTLFHRIWNEQMDFMVSTIEPRWLISALATFADHGKNENQRIIGASFNIFFSMLKLYEFERLASRPKAGPEYTHEPLEDRMPLDLTDFKFNNGDLDVNTIARLHGMCKKDPVAGFLGEVLLYQTLRERDTVFARMAKLKKSPIFARLFDREDTDHTPDPDTDS